MTATDDPRRPPHRLGPLRARRRSSPTPTSSGWSTRPTSGSCRAPGIRERRVAAAHETTASMGAVAGPARDPHGRPRARRHRPHPPRHPHARLLDALDGGARQGGDRQHAGRRVRRRWRPARASSTATRPARRTSPAGLAKHVLVIGAELLTRFLDYTDRSTCILFGDGAGAVVLSASDEPGGAVGHRADDRAAGRLHDLAARRRREEPAVGRDDRPRRALRSGWRARRRTASRPGRSRRPRSAVDREGRPRRRTTSTCSSRTRRTSGSSRRSPRASTCRWSRCSSTSTGTATRRPRRCRSPSPRPSTRAGSRSATSSCSSRSGPASRRGAVAIEWTADPARGRARDDAVRPEDVRVRLPVDWDSVDPIPAGARRDPAPAAPGRRRAARRRRARRAGARPPGRTLTIPPARPSRPPRRTGGARMIDLTGKTAVVTGGSRGIGRAIVLRLAAPGRRRRVQLPRQRRPPPTRRSPRSRRSAAGRSRSRPTSRSPRPPRRSSRRRSRRSARSTSSSTTPASPATT